MKKAVFQLLLALFFSCKLLAQELPLMNNLRLQPERIIKGNIYNALSTSKYQKCYYFAFSVRFELDKKTGAIKNLQFSENIVDTTIINIVRKAIMDTQSMWNLKNCKKANPSLTFLQPIYLFMNRNGCIPMKDLDVSLPNYARMQEDFAALIKFTGSEYPTVPYEPFKRFQISQEKFVGMVLSPILTAFSRA